MKTNKKTLVAPVLTAQGSRASRIDAELQLRRSVLANMLWENLFYEDGVSVTERISSLTPKVEPEKVASIAVEAREKQKLRHVPLLIVREMARHYSYAPYVAATLEKVIQRPDELTEFLSIYWKGKKQPLSNQVKKGLARAFVKFNEYSLAKYNQDKDIKLRDVLFLCHAKPKDQEQEAVWKRLVENKLTTPDTWEVELSKGSSDKKASWNRLLEENKLGALALLRNLRNMVEAGVDNNLIRNALWSCKAERVLPFRFITAARHAKDFESELEDLMYRCLAGREKLSGKTILVIDVSGSMSGRLSGKSELTRMDAGAALAMLVRELSDNLVVYATAGCDGSRIHSTKILPARRGFALVEEIQKATRSLGGGGIFLRQMMDYVYEKEKSADRVIVISDSQDCDINDTGHAPSKAHAFGKKNYLMDISCEQNGIGYEKFMVINGFSEALIDFVIEFERCDLQN